MTSPLANVWTIGARRFATFSSSSIAAVRTRAVFTATSRANRSNVSICPTCGLSDSTSCAAGGVVQSLAAALATLPDACVGGWAEGSASAARARICAYVQGRLDDPSLSPATVAAALGFSRGHVHRLFAGEDESLERYIWRLRVERVRADLEAPALAGVPIAELAARNGFASAEHFSRAFRARYGTTPAAHRRSAYARSASNEAGVK